MRSTRSTATLTIVSDTLRTLHGEEQPVIMAHCMYLTNRSMQMGGWCWAECSVSCSCLPLVIGFENGLRLRPANGRHQPVIWRRKRQLSRPTPTLVSAAEPLRGRRLPCSGTACMHQISWRLAQLQCISWRLASLLLRSHACVAAVSCGGMLLLLLLLLLRLLYGQGCC